MKKWPLLFILGIPIVLILLFVWFRHVGFPEGGNGDGVRVVRIQK
jgi:hypothetical protein